jgi:hypothetical protein
MMDMKIGSESVQLEKQTSASMRRLLWSRIITMNENT